jgi:hypothetical protein
MDENEKRMGEILGDKTKIREIFEDGTDEQVDMLLALEEDSTLAKETRDLIKEVREDLEKNHHYLGGTGIAGSGNYRIGRTPNLSETEGNND